MQLEPIRVLCNLLLVGECPPILKIGDVIPFLKDWRRTRPITCMDPIFKLVDAVIGRRLMQVLQEYGLLPEGTFGFIKGGAPDWPADLVSGVQWHARREQVASCQAFLDATSAYDTINHSGISSACHVFAVPMDVESRLMSHLGGHSRVLNTVYCLGEVDKRAEIDGGVAQGAPSSPIIYIFTTAVAQACANGILKGYQLPRLKHTRTVNINTNVNNMRTDLRICQPLTHPQHANQDFVNVKLKGYADDNVVSNGAKVRTLFEAQAIMSNLEKATETLTIGLGVVGVRTNLDKSFLNGSPMMRHLLGKEAKVTVAALNSVGQLVRAPITVATTHGVAEANTPAGRGAVKYLGPSFSSGGCYDKNKPEDNGYWLENRNAVHKTLAQVDASVNEVQASYDAVCQTANSSYTNEYRHRGWWTHRHQKWKSRCAHKSQIADCEL